MEWYLIWLGVCLLGGVLALVFHHLWIFIVTAIVSAICLVAWKWDVFDKEYGKWKDAGMKGDHPWYEWEQAKESHAWVMGEYKSSAFVKIRFDAFRRYFQVNHDRYAMYPGYVVFDDEDDRTVIRMVFPRRDLWKYYRFRRYWLQSRKMTDVLKFVQADIEKTREEAAKQIEDARAMLSRDFGDAAGLRVSESGNGESVRQV